MRPSSTLEHRKRTCAVVAVALLAGTTLLPGAAAPDEEVDTSGWNVVVETTGQTVPFDELGQLLAEPTASEREVTPFLIHNPAAWGSCFGPFCNRDYSLAALDDVPMARNTIHLQCGPHDTKSCGSHHIQQNHQRQWQQRIDDANAMTGRLGGNWDDPMAFSAMAATTCPERWTVQYAESAAIPLRSPSPISTTTDSSR